MRNRHRHAYQPRVNALRPVRRRHRIRRLVRVAGVVLELPQPERNAGVFFVLRTRPPRAEAESLRQTGRGRGLLLVLRSSVQQPEHLPLAYPVQIDPGGRIPRMDDDLPRRMIVPVADCVHTNVVVPGDVLDGMEEVVARGERAQRHRNLLAEEVKFRIVRHLLDETPRGKQKSCREEARRNRSSTARCVWNLEWLEPGNAFLREGLDGDPLRRSGEHLVSTGSKRRRRERIGVRTEDRLRAFGLAHHPDELRIPARREAAVRIDLQKPLLALPQLHDLGPRPARAAAVPPVDIENAKSRILPKRQRRLRCFVLPADAKAKQAGFVRLRQQVFHRGNDLYVAIGRDRNKDKSVFRDHTPPLRSGDRVRRGYYSCAGPEIIQHRACRGGRGRSRPDVRSVRRPDNGASAWRRGCKSAPGFDSGDFDFASD